MTARLREENEGQEGARRAREREELPLFADQIDPARLERMRKAADLAEQIVPTRPHAGVESALASMLVGPFASRVGRTRDAIAGKR